MVCSPSTHQGVRLRFEGYWLASGILGVSASILRRVADAGADVVVTKSIGIRPREGHPGPIVTASHGGLLNAVGLTNPGIDAFADEILLLREWNVPFVLSIFGSTVDEIVRVAVRGVEAGAPALELNLSCPHAEISQIAHDPETTYEYVRAVRDAVDCPILAKLSPNASDIVAVGLAAERAGADAVVAVNTLRAMRIDIDLQQPVLGNLVGGLSGPPVFPVAVRCVYDLFSALSIPIVGVGGVTTWRDAIEMHMAGASAIQVGTAVLKGVEVFRRIKRGVQRYLRDRGFSSTNEIVGIAAGR
ncbi:MAG TPA: dihydroorotate dehydrogenase [Candidatus Thorarchaeota archaeon]|nr:MAG: dihydroorotate dehydrogenase [Candidatus Thorarchaeota archaeon]RLI61824.1 MAG: dihydroorotate dehydrogenase [Candidatus Thorarchaeota archaeon]HDD67186.1 dihydroorotate dehydrogenase [Candidatus Thorarchaeota archaeon]